MGVVDPFSVARAAGLELTGKPEGLTLTDGAMELRADFARMLSRLKQGRLQQELLVKAARTKGIEQPWAIDATACFGEDSLLLAAAGFTVDLYEQDCVIAALLQDALFSRCGGKSSIKQSSFPLLYHRPSPDRNLFLLIKTYHNHLGLIPHLQSPLSVHLRP